MLPWRRLVAGSRPRQGEHSCSPRLLQRRRSWRPSWVHPPSSRLLRFPRLRPRASAGVPWAPCFSAVVHPSRTLFPMGPLGNVGGRGWIRWSLSRSLQRGKSFGVQTPRATYSRLGGFPQSGGMTPHVEQAGGTPEVPSGTELEAAASEVTSAFGIHFALGTGLLFAAVCLPRSVGGGGPAGGLGASPLSLPPFGAPPLPFRGTAGLLFLAK